MTQTPNDIPHETPTDMMPLDAAANMMQTHRVNLSEMSLQELAGYAQSIYHEGQYMMDRYQAMLMEVFWTMRQRFESDAAFEDNFSEIVRIPHLKAGHISGMVATWGAARKNRELRALTNNQPKQALIFVRKLEDTELEADDPRVTELLTMAPAKRNRKLKELIDAREAYGAGHHPDDHEALKTAEAERDAALAELAAKQKGTEAESLTAQLHAQIEQLKTLEGDLAHIIRDCAASWPQGAWDGIDAHVLANFEQSLTGLSVVITDHAAALNALWQEHIG